MRRFIPSFRRKPESAPPDRRQCDSRHYDDRKAIAWILLVVGAYLLISAAMYLFEDFTYSVIDTPGSWFKSGAPNLLLAIIAVVVIVLYIILGLPGGFLTRWGALGLGLLCYVAAGVLYWQLRRNRRR